MTFLAKEKLQMFNFPFSERKLVYDKKKKEATVLPFTAILLSPRQALSSGSATEMWSFSDVALTQFFEICMKFGNGVAHAKAAGRHIHTGGRVHLHFRVVFDLSVHQARKRGLQVGRKTKNPTV